MNLENIRFRSLQTRLTLFMLLIFLIGIWSLAYYASRTLRADMERLLSEQQFSTAALVAAEVNASLGERIGALALAAKEIDTSMMGNPAQLQALLESKLDLESRFNRGVMLIDGDGIVRADVPRSSGRIGLDVMERDYAIGPLKEGQATIGLPIKSRIVGAPVFVVAVPVRDSHGNVIGALGGEINLGAPNFLDRIAESRYGLSGGYLVVAPRQRLIITATDKSRIMEKLPPPGVNSGIDRFMTGYEGSAVLHTARGEEMLISSKHVQVANWDVVVSLPTTTAFAPIIEMQQRMIKATLVLTVLAALLVWWMLRRLLSPLKRAAEILLANSQSDKPIRSLSVTRDDEVGALIGGFNRLLGTLEQRERALRHSEARFRGLTAMSSDWFWEQDREFRFVEFSEAFSENFSTLSEVLGKTRWELGINLMPEQWAEHRAMLEAHKPFKNFEYSISNDRGDERWFAINGEPLFDEVGNFSGYRGTGRDITKRKLAEQAMRVAAAAFESQECMIVTDANNIILRVNRAFTDVTGFLPEDVIGQSPSLLKSGRHPPEFYRAMWDSINSSGGWQGEILGRRKNGEIYPKWLSISVVKNDDGEITHYIGAHYDITHRKRAEEKINELAFFDPLTNLPNRRLLRDRLKRAMVASNRSGRYGALLFIDLDNFKTLNDTLGHDVGDLLLQQVAERLSGCVREGDTVARLGGDEFVIMLEGLSEDPRQAATQSELVGEKVLDALNRTYHLGRHEHHNTPSIGVALFADHQGTIEELLKWADLAMYQAKAAGRNTLRFFDPEMQAVVTARAALEADLREAIQRNQFLVYYQPQIDGQSGLTGVEALVRWRHPERGLVSPAEFIPLAEDSGLIVPVGRWVLKTACAQLKAWAEHPDMERLTIAVNVSPRQFHRNDFVQQVLAAIEHTGANPHRLKLELTESIMADDVEEIIAKMTTLKAQGVGFSLDDFGTGYSSLSYLKRLPLDQLKIDQSFVRDILTDSNDAAISRTVVALAGSLGLAVIAEGVETEAHREFLAAQGCLAYQGYLYSRPLPIDAFEAWCAEYGTTVRAAATT